MIKTKILATTLMAGLMLIVNQSYGKENLVPEGNFKSVKGKPKGWESENLKQNWMLSRFKVKEENNKNFIQVNKAPAVIKVEKPVDPGWKKLKLSFDSRRTGIKPGNKSWLVPLAELNFRDANGKDLDTWKRSIWFPKDTKGWEKVERIYNVPQGAKTVRCLLGFKADAGTADFADLQVTLEEGKSQGISKLKKAKERPSRVAGLDFSKVTGAKIDESVIKTTLWVDTQAEPGGNGQKATPFKTVKEAVVKAKKLIIENTPVRISILPGTYREGEFRIEAIGDALLVIEAEKPGTVTITGSDIFPADKWKKVTDKQGKIFYETAWIHDFGFNPGGWKVYNPKNPYEHRRELVFINGQPMRQVLLEKYTYDPKPKEGKTDSFKGVPQNVKKYGIYTYLGKAGPEILPPGSFGVYERDENGNKLCLRLPEGVKLENAKIEIAVRSHLLWVFKKSNFVLRGITFQHAANRIEAHKAVMIGRWWRTDWTKFEGKNVLIEDCIFQYNNGNQLSLTHIRDITLRRNRIVYGAYGGLNIAFSQNLLMEDNDTSFNNWRVSGGWAAGAIKIHQAIDTVIRRHTSIGNETGAGLWFDISCGDTLIEDAILIGNRMALDWEISRGMLVKNSILADSITGNLAVISGMDVVLENCILSGSPGVGQIIFQSANRDANDKIYPAIGRKDAPGKYYLDRLELKDCVIASYPQEKGRKGKTDHNGTVKEGFIPPLFMQHHGNPEWFAAYVANGILSINNIWWTTAAKPYSLRKSYHSKDWRKKAPVCQMLTPAEWQKITGEQKATIADPKFANPAKYDFQLQKDSLLQGKNLPTYTMPEAKQKELSAFKHAPYRVFNKGNEVNDVILTK